MSQYQLLKKINQIRNAARRTKPDAAWVLATRSTLLMQAKNSQPTSVVQRSSVFKEWVKFFSPLFSFGKWMRKPAFSIAAIILAIFGGSLISVSAAERSLPGDLLYSVKLATEQARLALAKNPQDRVMLKTEFTGRRVDEMKQVVAGSASDRGDKVIQTAEVLKRDMHTIKQQLDDMQGQSSPQTVKDTAKMVDEKSNAVVQALQDSKDTMTSEEKVKVTEAQAAASDTSVKAIEMLVETNKTSADVVTDQDVADIMKTHNESVVKTMAQSVGLNPDTATSTGSLSLPISNKTMTSSTAAVLEKVTEAQKSFNEADKLVSEDKIDEAMAKVKLGTQQAFAAQKTVEQADVAADATAANQQIQVSGSATSTAATGTTKTTTSTSQTEDKTINSNPTTTKPAP